VPLARRNDGQDVSARKDMRNLGENMRPKKSWDDATKRMMLQVNETPISKDELINVVQEVGESDPENRDMEGHALVAVRLYSNDPLKVKAIMFRLEALVNLLVDEGASGWTLSLPNGAVLTQEPVFAAAAVQPLIEQDGNVVFERETFLDKVLELAEVDQIG
jgi:hypothetical protein